MLWTDRQPVPGHTATQRPTQALSLPLIQPGQLNRGLQAWPLPRQTVVLEKEMEQSLQYSAAASVLCPEANFWKWKEDISLLFYKNRFSGPDVNTQWVKLLPINPDCWRSIPGLPHMERGNQLCFLTTYILWHKDTRACTHAIYRQTDRQTS